MLQHIHPRIFNDFEDLVQWYRHYIRIADVNGWQSEAGNEERFLVIWRYTQKFGMTLMRQNLQLWALD